MSIEALYLLRKDESGAPLRDLDAVRILVDVVTDDGDTIRAGREGTVVGVWRGGEAYEVEFPEPMGALATITAADLARAGRPAP